MLNITFLINFKYYFAFLSHKTDFNYYFFLVTSLFTYKKLVKWIVPILAGVGANTLLFVPMVVVALIITAIKAVIISKMAFLITGFMTLRKLFAGSNYDIFNKVHSVASSLTGGNDLWNTASPNAHPAYYNSPYNSNNAAEIAYSAQQPPISNVSM